MSNTAKITLDTIKSYRAAKAEARKEVEKTSAALESAEIEARNSGKDDGKTPIEELYQAAEKARKNLFMRQTEASRAAVKLEKIEDEHEALLRNGVPTLLPSLQAKIDEATENLRTQLSPLVANGDSFCKASLNDFIKNCDDVRERQRTLVNLRNHLDSPSWDPSGELLPLAAERALELL